MLPTYRSTETGAIAGPAQLPGPLAARPARPGLVLWSSLAASLAAGCVCGADPDRPPTVERDGQSYLLCGRVVDDREEESVRVGDLTLRRRGLEIERLGEQDGRTVLGVVAGTEEWNEPNRENLDAMVAWLREQGAEAIVVAGGIGPDRQTCVDVLGRLAASGLPVLSVIGASADFAGYRRAVAEVRRSHPNLVDLTLARLVHWDGVDLVSLPGYHNPFYLRHRRGGCSYRQGDVRALSDLIGRARAPVLLVAADAPRGRGPRAIDFARGGANIGSPLLAEALGSSRVPFGLFGHVYEAGGRATADVAGQRAVAEGTWSPSLYLNPGALEAVPYDLVGGGRSRGMGALLEIGPEGARYRVRRLRSEAGP